MISESNARMQVTEQHHSLESAVPKAALVLQDLRGVTTFEDSYAARHPFAAYNISLSAIARRLTAVVENLAELEGQSQLASAGQPLSDERLLEATDHLLDSLMEHMDVCNGILRSFYAPADEKKFKKALAAFKTSVEPYRKHIGSIDNYIKHNQGKLRSIHFQWATGRCWGYFVEGPVERGVLGPASTIHSGNSTAFSFNRDIPYHLCNVFAVGARLANAIHSIDRRLVPLARQSSASVQDSDWGKAIRAAATLPAVFFPDELVKGVPKIQAIEGKVLIEYPATRMRVTTPPPGAQISLSLGGDGVTRSFKMPYFDGNG